MTTTSTSKHFKSFDKAFSPEQIQACRDRYCYSLKTSPKMLDGILGWEMKLNSWDQDFVQYCVYSANDHRDWQLFRVSMKGMSTREKLFMLYNYYTETEQVSIFGKITQIYNVRKCRIDNYIGALKRAGILDDGGNIIKD